MKAKFLIGISLLTGIALSSFAQKNPIEYKIHGTLKDMGNPQWMYLYNGDHLLDSARVNDNQYEFKGKLVNPEQLTLKQNAQNAMNLLVDKGDIDVTSDGTMRYSKVDGTGVEMQKEWEKAFVSIDHKRDSLTLLYSDPALKTDPDRTRKIWRMQLEVLSLQRSHGMDYLKRNPSSPASPEIIMQLIGISAFVPQLKVSREAVDSLISTLEEPYKTRATASASVMYADLGKATPSGAGQKDLAVIGQRAVNFTQSDPQGKPVSLSSFKGKYVLVDFWASWCAPCRAENPNVVKAYEQYKEKGLEILGVSLDGLGTKTAWLDAIKKDGLNWTQVSDLTGWSNAVAKLYGVTAIPQNFLIDPNGVIVGKNLRGEALTQKLATIFK